MSQITSGIRSVLSNPVIYDFIQNILGAKKVRKELIDKVIRPEPGVRILDLGCGTAEILKYLPRAVEYWGYDISPEYIERARAAYGERGNFHCGMLSTAELAELPKFDVVLAIGVLHHLDDREATDLFELAHNALHPDGRVITIDPCLADNQNLFARFLIKKDRGQNVRRANEYMSLTKTSFSQTKGVLRHRRWIPYTHWIMECRK
jgi:cyclopropane fatty-acyl-phospholipid synthase-like methyltransferase